MKTQSPDFENINDNLPIEHQLGIIRRWAEQAGCAVVKAHILKGAAAPRQNLAATIRPPSVPSACR